MSSADERLIVMLEARISEFEKRMKKAEGTGTNAYNRLRRGSRGATQAMEADMIRSTNRINQALAASSTRIGVFGKTMLAGLAGGAIVAGINGLTSGLDKTIASIAELGDQAKRAGVAVEEFQRWKFVAEQNRIGIDQMTDGLKELQLRADEFVVTGAGAAAEAFERMGFIATDLKDRLKEPSELMLEIIGRLGRLDKAAQIRVADEVFGGSAGERFVELLDQGEAGIRHMMGRANTLSDEQIRKAQELDRRYKEMTTNLANGWKSVAVGVADFIAQLTIAAEAQTALEQSGLFDSDGKSRAVLGDDVADRLNQSTESIEANREAIVSLTGEYEAFKNLIGALSPQIQGVSNRLVQLEETEAADAMGDLSDAIRDLIRMWDAGQLKAGEFEDKLGDLIEEAAAALTQIEAIDTPTFQNVLARIKGLGEALETLTGKAAAARAAMPGGSQAEFAKYGVDPHAGQEGWAPTHLAPTTSKPPRAAPNDWGAPVKTDTGGGGGSKGNHRLDQLVESLQTEREILDAWYQESLDLLNGATEQQLEALGGKHEAIERLEKEHRERMAGIQDASQQWSLQSALSGGAEVLSAMGAFNKKALKISQVFAAGEALISTYQGAAKELRAGTFGFANAAAVIAKGLGFVAAIKGVNASGGGVSGGGRSGASSAVAPVQAQSSSPVTVTIQGIRADTLYSGKQVMDMTTAVQKELTRRGVKFVYTS